MTSTSFSQWPSVVALLKRNESHCQLADRGEGGDRPHTSHSFVGTTLAERKLES